MQTRKALSAAFALALSAIVSFIFSIFISGTSAFESKGAHSEAFSISGSGEVLSVLVFVISTVLLYKFFSAHLVEEGSDPVVSSTSQAPSNATIPTKPKPVKSTAEYYSVVAQAAAFLISPFVGIAAAKGASHFGFSHFNGNQSLASGGLELIFVSWILPFIVFIAVTILVGAAFYLISKRGNTHILVVALIVLVVGQHFLQKHHQADVTKQQTIEADQARKDFQSLSIASSDNSIDFTAYYPDAASITNFVASKSVIFGRSSDHASQYTDKVLFTSYTPKTEDLRKFYINEFPVTKYYNPPTNCGAYDATYDTTGQYKCVEVGATSGGTKIYYVVDKNVNANLYTVYGKTVVTLQYPPLDRLKSQMIAVLSSMQPSADKTFTRPY